MCGLRYFICGINQFFETLCHRRQAPSLHDDPALVTDLLLFGFRVRIPLTWLPFSSLILLRFVEFDYL